MPSMSFHGTAVLERAGVEGVGSVFQEVLEQVNCKIQIVVIHIAAVDVEFTCQARSDSRPVVLDVVPEIVAVIAHVSGNFMVDFACSFVP